MDPMNRDSTRQPPRLPRRVDPMVLGLCLRAIRLNRRCRLGVTRMDRGLSRSLCLRSRARRRVVPMIPALCLRAIRLNRHCRLGAARMNRGLSRSLHLPRRTRRRVIPMIPI
ncbi:hypothetical protein A5764_08830 [Mycobacterium sp. 852002-51057_SCH5723018]|nr:hypothetical protein A5764_08830 [Mycobacterium sp. 852002-51057_SCH5723018]